MIRRALFIGQACDAVTFALFFLVVPATILAELGKAERNPVIATLFALGGFMAVVLVKIGATSLVIWRDGRRPNRPRKTAAFMVAAALSGYIGAAANVWALVLVLGALG